MRVDELSGIALDFWLIKAEGKETPGLCYDDDGVHAYNPLPFIVIIDWEDIGPIVERDKILLAYNKKITWVAFSATCEVSGSTALEAIKRCIVKRKYGEEVEEARR